MSKALHLTVERALFLHARIAADRKELKALTKELETAALARPEDHVPLEDPAREGRQFLIHGEGVTVPVIITADALAKSFQAHSEKHSEISHAAGGRFSEFYRYKPTYEAVTDDAVRFRALAREILGDHAPRFITACLLKNADGIPINKVVVDYDRAQPTPQKGATPA